MSECICLLFQQGDCGGHFNISSGVLTSPSYPGKYPSSVDCDYKITLSNGSYINLEVLTFDLYPLSDSEDIVEIRDGHLHDSPLIGTYTGTFIKEIIQSAQNHLWLRYPCPVSTPNHLH